MKTIMYLWKDDSYKEILEINESLLVRGEDRYAHIVDTWLEEQEEILAIKVLPKLAKTFSNGYVEVQIIDGESDER